MENEASCDKLQLRLSIQQERPLNTYLDLRTGANFVLGEVLRDHQDAIAAHTERTARAAEVRRAGERTEANAQVQWIWTFRLAVRTGGSGTCRTLILFRIRENAGK